MNEQNNNEQSMSDSVSSSVTQEQTVKSRRPFWRFFNSWRTFEYVVLNVLAVILIVWGLRVLFRETPNVDALIGEGVVVDEPVVPTIQPDYADCVVPPNIAPLNFEICDDGDEFLTRISLEDRTLYLSGKVVDVDVKRWRRFLKGGEGKQIKIEVFARRGKDSWHAFKPIQTTIAPTPIDPWLHYRAIEPGYEYFNRVVLAERSLESFDERVWFDAKSVNNRTCVNCHSFQSGKTDNFVLHTRRVKGGTILCWNGRLTKVDPKLSDDSLGIAYPAWNPQEPFLAFSTNSTFQMFHSSSPDRVEVLDAASDLVLFDPEHETITPICQTDDLLETFPSWSPDGRSLFYCVAKSPYSADEPASATTYVVGVQDVFGNAGVLDQRKVDAPRLYAEFHYDLARRTFDPKTRRFGEPEILVDASSQGKSVAHPRLSPDGKTLIFTQSKYGTFPIWRRDADLWSYDMTTGETRALDELNSTESESWHEWDSSGRWLAFSSRRDDGTFTRVYFAYYSPDGKWSKPFLLPQRDPRSNRDYMKSYNLPVFTVEPMKRAPRELVKVGRQDARAIRAKR